MRHRWSGWPGAWCLDCGLEDRAEVELAGAHRYTEIPHLDDDCPLCSDTECRDRGSGRNDPYREPLKRLHDFTRKQGKL